MSQPVAKKESGEKKGDEEEAEAKGKEESKTGDKQEEATEAIALTSSEFDTSSRSPRVSPCGKYVAYLSTFNLKTHDGSSKLCLLDWETKVFIA